MRKRERQYSAEQAEVGRHLLPEEKKRAEFREPRVPRWVYRLIFILALCALGVAAWFNRANLAPENLWNWVRSSVVGLGVGDGYPKTFSGSTVEQGNFLVSEKNVIFASDTSLTACNSTGKELLSVQHGFSSPTLRAAGIHVMLYNLGGKSCLLETASGEEVKLTADANILCGAVAANGRSVLLTAADNYCGRLTAYDAKGKVLSYYWFSEYYPTAAAMSPDGTKAAVAGVSAKDGVISSAVYVIDLSSDAAVQPAAASSGNMLCAVCWDTDSAVEAIGDTGILFLNPSTGEKREYDFGGSKLTAFCGNGGRVAVSLAPFESSQSQTLLVLDSSGNSLFTRQFSGKIRSVSLFGQTAAALSDGTVSFFTLASPSDAGKTCSAGSDARAVALKDETSAYILGISEVRLTAEK